MGKRRKEVAQIRSGDPVRRAFAPGACYAWPQRTVRCSAAPDGVAGGHCDGKNTTMRTRIFAVLISALALSGCASYYDGYDGYDSGAGYYAYDYPGFYGRSYYYG